MHVACRCDILICCDIVGGATKTVHKSKKSSGLACSVSQCSYPSIAKEVMKNSN